MDRYQERIEQIKDVAKTNNGRVSYTVIADIIKDKNSMLEESELKEVIQQLVKDNITVLEYEEDEGYEAIDNTDPGKFLPADVSIGQQPMSMSNIISRLENSEIKLDPEFQRRGGLWTEEQQSQLIESLMLKIPLPEFYFDASDEGEWVVIDGLQRLTAFQNYIAGVPDENAIGGRSYKKLQGLEYLRDFNGYTYEELPRQYKRRILETQITVYTIEKGTPDEVVFNIFKRINTGGLRLEEQEIRHALYPGKAMELSEKLAESEEFLEATQKAVSPLRMLDREYIIRYMAFTELDYQEEYKGNIDSYMIMAIKRVNAYDEERLQVLEDEFKEVMSYCSKIFGKYAFRKYNGKTHRRGPINKALFELCAICLKGLTREQRQRLLNNKDAFLKQYFSLFNHEEFNLALKAGDKYSVTKRVDMVNRILKEYVC